MSIYNIKTFPQTNKVIFHKKHTPQKCYQESFGFTAKPPAGRLPLSDHLKCFHPHPLLPYLLWAFKGETNFLKAVQLSTALNEVLIF